MNGIRTLQIGAEKAWNLDHVVSVTSLGGSDLVVLDVRGVETFIRLGGGKRVVHLLNLLACQHCVYCEGFIIPEPEQ